MSYHKAIADMFGAMGVGAVQIGSTVIQTNKPKVSTDVLRGHGDDVRVGDVVRCYESNYGSNGLNPHWHDELTELQMITNLNLETGDINWVNIDGSRPFGLFRYPMTDPPQWKRIFKLASEEETRIFKDRIQYCDIYLRTFFTYGIPERRRVLVPLSLFLYYNGDIRLAFQSSPSGYGKLPLKCMDKFDGLHAWKWDSEGKLVKMEIPEPLRELVAKAREKENRKGQR